MLSSHRSRLGNHCLRRFAIQRINHIPGPSQHCLLFEVSIPHGRLHVGMTEEFFYFVDRERETRLSYNISDWPHIVEYNEVVSRAREDGNDRRFQLECFHSYVQKNSAATRPHAKGGSLRCSWRITELAKEVASDQVHSWDRRCTLSLCLAFETYR